MDAELIRKRKIKEATWHFFRSANTGEIGPSKPLLDFTPRSLRILWSWFIPYVKLVAKSVEEIECELKNAPKWLKDELRDNKFKLSNETLAIAMDIAIYIRFYIDKK